MERSTGAKWKKIYDEDGAPSPIDEEEDAPMAKQKALGDEQPLVTHEDEPADYAGPQPLLLQKPLFAWATAGLGVLFLVVVVLVVRGGTLHAPRAIAGASEAAAWVERLPSDVERHIDRAVDPCGDFYAFSCGAWQQQAEIPDDRASVFLSFSTVHDENEKVLKELMQQGWPLVGELYDSCMNFSNSSSTTADEASLKVLAPVLQQIAATKNKQELFQVAGELSKAGPDFLTGLSVSADAREATTYALYASQSGLSLPDPQYYLDKKKFDPISDAFHAYVVELFLLAGWESGAAASRASAVIGFEQTLAPLFVPKEKLQDPVATYNRMNVAQVADEFPLTFAQFVNGTGLLDSLKAHSTDVIVEAPAYFERVEKLLAGDTVTLDTLKAVLTYQYISTFAGVLSEPFVQASFSFFARTLRGQKARAPRWKVCLQRVTDNFPDLVGKYFALMRFDQASEQLASQLVTQVQTSLQKNLGRVDWLDGVTRQAALEKLGNMTNLIGHSTRSEHFPYELRSDAPLADNMRIVKQHAFERAVARIGGPVDRNKWVMTSAAVNAYYQPTANQIVFPAGILQPPFFARGRHPARNFGAIGAVIGHELTHGFDASGRYYAGDGNLQDWWSNKTAEEFSKRTECLVNQYDNFAVTSGADADKVLGYVNGNYTLSENIADNGGVKLSFAAYQEYIDKLSEADTTEAMSQEEQNLPANEAEKLFFISFAQAFCAKTSDASATQRLATDPHSPERWRINGMASNSRDFARVFSCPAGSPMNPKTKCQLW
ncbi:Endothelin-converting enzyme 1 [Phytophthora fragariae]|uniref:Endothelin-converting enzyme 1 n=1 Tax=Phytophthora fragariae TaxID=53985 RepID=A0A6A3SFL7_9STRA|nr:Endothelin-converting enzyme 1 [Phytophthora fragariae]KAE8937558.1 Endothelin-converting enzyme 1 [Phytophthora fragariae]KAE9009569.1 Endothelin-converting enzyme 1 [Phytophthora fragariae]KAE9111347.1 Endothelin-converting enzyme 1 [Phytophthora fragariae]KAE9144456.1 Endothelin-converting enzyme 1 [Phytophthora fragariae]